MNEHLPDEWENDTSEPWRGEDDPTQTPVTKRASRKPKEVDGGEDKDKEKVGGFAFFLSLGALLPTGVITLCLAIAMWPSESTAATVAFAISIPIGIVLAHLTVRRHISVLLHEFKHSLISNLVGNKRKGMKVDERSGSFTYSYTKKTAHYNAFISLAPYIVPLFTFLGSLLALAFARHDHLRASFIVGMMYGVDLLLNVRDISPVQTDISLIKGGYNVGLLYIVAWNLMIAGVLLAWVFQDSGGFFLLLEGFSRVFLGLHTVLSGNGE